jgi:hypothetical protein
MGKKNDSKAQAYAAWMKDHGIRRTTARCSVCYRVVALPLDKHLFWNCK